MFNDETATELRKDFIAQNNAAVQSDNETLERQRLEAIHGVGNVWNTKELQENFQVLSFLAPFCSVIRRSDKKKGVVEFQHSPRFYWGFQLI
jgi:hypothetical protein